MKITKNKIFASAIVLAVGVFGTFYLSSCRKKEITSPANQSQQGSNINAENNSLGARLNNVYTGEELFNGIFFSAGEFATLLPNVNSPIFCKPSSQSDKQAKEKLLIYLDSTIKSTTPNFFNNLKSNFKSVAINQYDDLIENASIQLLMAMLTRQDFLDDFSGKHKLNKNQIKNYVQGNNKNALKQVVKDIKGDLTAGTFNLKGIYNQASIQALVAPNIFVFSRVTAIVWVLNASSFDKSLTHEAAIQELFNAISTIN